MLKQALNNPALRKRAKQFGHLVRHSAMTPRTGETHKPVLVSNGQMGVTFIGHASFFLQIGGENVVVDPNFAPGCSCSSAFANRAFACPIFPPSISC